MAAERATADGGAAQAFFDLVSALGAELHGDEVLLASFAGERSTFARINHAKVRQLGTVDEGEIVLELVRDGRRVRASSTLSLDADEDRSRSRAMLGRLRELCQRVRPDPYLSYGTEAFESVERHAGELPPAQAALGSVLERAGDDDLVGVLQTGPVRRGFASSLGARAWFETETVQLDVSLHAAAGAAVKLSLGGRRWDENAVLARIDEARSRLALLQAPAHEPAPGRYRAYLAPSALEEIFLLLSWGAFGIEAQRTRQSPLLKMIAEDRRLSPAVTISEHSASGLVARFTSQGFRKPERVVLVDHGAIADCLADARSAKQYGVAVNAEMPSPEALEMDAGELPAERALAELGDGLYLSDLWYTNYSDRNDCAITGMTRFACFWVENGKLAAPLAPMRFDDSLYRMLGDSLLAITRERERLLDVRTYGGRSLRSMLLPGVLVGDLRLAL